MNAAADASPSLPPHVQPVALGQASRLVNHGPTVLISTAHEGRRNLMAAAWSMPVEFTPPRIAVVIDKQTATCEIVSASGMLALVLPGRAMADVTYTVGSVSAHDEPLGSPDKFERYGIATWPGPVLGLPLPLGAAAWLECRVLRDEHTAAVAQAYDTWFVEVLGAWADERVFRGGRWSLREDNAALHTLHHLGGGLFGLPAVQVQARRLPEPGAG